MKRALIIIAAFTALSFTGMAQDENNKYETGGLRNARGWVTWTNDTKLAYLYGYVDHWSATAEDLSKLPHHEGEIDGVPSLTFAETIKELDALFAEPANANLTIRMGLVIVSAKVMGYSAKDVQTLTERARKDATTQSK